MTAINAFDIEPLNAWIDNLNKPLFIAGPCSAESEKQVLNIASTLSKNKQVRIFRAGIWKPRTSPKSFQGHGAKALKWLKDVKEKTGLLTAVEVASPKHVEECLKNGVDVLWIGARTTVNPFSVEDIAKALSGVDIPVLIKNPLNPDIDLWIGAIERFYLSGIKKLAAVHRGFYTYEKTVYRNHPIWEIPIELKRLYPNLPLICDPSHIAGKANLVGGISQKALNLDFSGLMIEVHTNPRKAISDPEQQLNIKSFEKLLSSLSVRKETGDVYFEERLEELRLKIDDIDALMLNLLKSRMDIVKEIGKYKKEQNISILQIKRWNTIFNERTKLGLKLGLNEKFISDILKIVHENSIITQHKIMSKE